MKHMRSHIKSDVRLLIFLERNNNRLAKRALITNSVDRCNLPVVKEVGLRLPVFLLTLPGMPLV